MFNDKCGLTDAVLEGRKTQTRRAIRAKIINYADTSCFFTFEGKPLSEAEKDYNCYETMDGDFVDIRGLAPYKIGEVVAVAQSYNDVFHVADADAKPIIDKIDCNNKGWSNKMFVKAELMPHHIRITNIRVEQLQDISDEDCLKEGIVYKNGRYYVQDNGNNGVWNEFDHARDAYSFLIGKVSGKGTWESNPYVFVYDFELVE